MSADARSAAAGRGGHAPSSLVALAPRRVSYLEAALGKKNKLPQKLQPWVDARKRHHLSHAQVQMARELGLNPKKLGGYAENPDEPWKAPLPLFIEHLYERRFGRSAPTHVRSIEQVAADQRRKKEERRSRKARPKPGEGDGDAATGVGE